MEGYLYKKMDSIEMYVKPLSNDDWAVCFVNRSHKNMPLNYKWDDVITDTLFNKTFDAKTNAYKILNVWSGKQSDTKKSFTAKLESHDCLLLRLQR